MNTYLTKFKSSFKRTKSHDNALDNNESVFYLSEIDSDIFTYSTSFTTSTTSTTSTKSKTFKFKNPFGFIDRKIKQHIAKVQKEEDELDRIYFIKLLTSGYELHPYYRELLTKLAFKGYEMKEDVVQEYYDEVVNGAFHGIWLDGEERSIEFCRKKHRCSRLFRKLGYSVPF